MVTDSPGTALENQLRRAFVEARRTSTILDFDSLLTARIGFRVESWADRTYLPDHYHRRRG